MVMEGKERGSNTICALPYLVGPAAFGVKMGAIVSGTDLKKMTIERLKSLNQQGFVHDDDILCITESVVARAQDNYVSLDEVAKEVRENLDINSESNIGVVFPILSRNRFSLILKALARAVNEGTVTVQLSFPSDEVGNQILDEDILEDMGKGLDDTISYSELVEYDYRHQLTGVNYLTFYHQLITSEGAEANIFLSNDPCKIVDHEPDGVIAADIHTCTLTMDKIGNHHTNCITLKNICCHGECSSEWGLLGSNLSVEDRLKLLPKDSDIFVNQLQKGILEATGKKLHVMVYGDGAYKDPESGIYELADPCTTFGATDGLTNRYREGIKYKYLADKLNAKGKDVKEIEKAVELEKEKQREKDSFATEGTTPRQLTDVLASLADLVSGSADAGTPVVLVKNFL